MLPREMLPWQSFVAKVSSVTFLVTLDPVRVNESLRLSL